jgi:hypothetical protein
MKKILTGLAALSLIASFAFFTTTSAATPPGQNKLLCFSGTLDTADNEGYGPYTGTCTLQGKGARGPATLNNNDGDSDPYNNYSGVYIETPYLSGTALADVNKLQFNYTGEATPGSPRFSILVQDGADQFYAYVSAYYCNDGAGAVDVINDATCTIYTSNGQSYENWDAFVAAYPGATIAVGDYPVFIIADDPGIWTVSGVKIGR